MLSEAADVERCRQWGDNKKLGILLAAGAAGVTRARAAQHYEVARPYTFGRRRDLNKKGICRPVRGLIFCR